MCGISAVALKKGTVGPAIYDCLTKLEYRGYDSVGEATIFNDELTIKKDKGKIAEVEEKLHLSTLPGLIGIGHTRWATHGAPSKENAHPHTDCNNTVAVVHNGIIENFLTLREELEAAGHQLRSKTDTEVVAHLIEANLRSGNGFVESVRSAVKKLQGAYALAIISTVEPDKIVCVRRESPLVLGKGQDGNYCASDIPAFLSKTNKAILLEDDEMAVLTSNQIRILKIENGDEIIREPFTVDWNVDRAAKTGYAHFMLKEIHEQPLSIRNVSRTHPMFLDLMAGEFIRAKKIFLVACGTSYHACMGAAYAFSRLAALSVTSVVASEFIDMYGGLIDSETVVLAVSQSGETADTLNAVRGAKDRGAIILGITNTMGSSLTRLANVYIGQNSGPEMGVAATKTFTAQYTILIQIAIALARKRQVITQKEVERLECAISQLPDLISLALRQETRINQIADRFIDKNSFCFLARGVNVPTALEGRLKLLELSYLPAIAYPAGESKHGFISVVEQDYPVIFIAPRDETYTKIIGNIMEMKARGARIIALVDEQDKDVVNLSDEIVKLPSGIPSVLSPIVYVIPLQLFAYYMSVKKGNNPDFPRNLAKSVTVQ
ncbi:MAG: glutamine--fructose-6-phosphate transaminase (isomerizing) [Candidatus Bathyarchaeia archaeon]